MGVDHGLGPVGWDGMGWDGMGWDGMTGVECERGRRAAVVSLGRSRLGATAMEEEIDRHVMG